MTDTIPILVGYRIAFPSTRFAAQGGIPLPPIEVSLYEYVMAGNGIFIRGARREFRAQFCIQPCVLRGLRELDLSLQMNGSRVSSEIVAEMLRRSRSARDAKGEPCEIVFHLEFNEAGVWQCHVPNLRAGSGEEYLPAVFGNTR